MIGTRFGELANPEGGWFSPRTFGIYFAPMVSVARRHSSRA